MHHLSPSRVTQFLQSRFNPIVSLTAESLGRHLDAFESGNLRGAALAWDAIEKRDDIMKTVAPKRKKAVSRHGWEVLISSGGLLAKSSTRVLSELRSVRSARLQAGGTGLGRP